MKRKFILVMVLFVYTLLIFTVHAEDMASVQAIQEASDLQQHFAPTNLVLELTILAM